MKRILKHIITAMLAMAIAFTGISLDGTMTTANATASYAQLKDGSTVTMKVGETKRFRISDANGKDLIPQMAWKTSNKSIVMIDTDFIDDTRDLIEYIEFTANAAGTVTIRGRRNAEAAIDRYNGFEREHCAGDINITVTVTKASAKMTAAQKKCKHSWKVSRKATCQRVGEKVCKRCRLNKTIKKTDHKWETMTDIVPIVEDILFEGWADIDENTTPFVIIRLSDYATAEEMAHAHFKETMTDTSDGSTKGSFLKYDITGVSEEAEKAFFEAVNAMPTPRQYGMREVYGEELTAEVVTFCDYCGTRK